MEKQSPFYLKRPTSQTFDFKFEDRESNPDNCFEVTLRRLSGLDVVSYLEKSEEYIGKYVTGIDGEPARPLPPVGGEPCFVTPSTCRVLACIEYAQVQPEALRYSFVELAAIASVPKMGDQMLRAMQSIQPVEADPENPTSEPTASS